MKAGRDYSAGASTATPAGVIPNPAHKSAAEMASSGSVILTDASSSEVDVVVKVREIGAGKVGIFFICISAEMLPFISCIS